MTVVSSIRCAAITSAAVGRLSCEAVRGGMLDFFLATRLGADFLGVVETFFTLLIL